MPTNKPVALITGGSRGIGYAIAAALAREGYDLVINGRRPAEDVRDVVQQLAARGAAVLYVPADMGDAAQRDSLLQQVRERFGRLNVLVNNAAIAPRRRDDILQATEKNFEEVLRVNLQSPYFLTQAAAKWMVEQKRGEESFRGCIINIGSISATVASINRGEYCIAKAGMGMATHLWATRLAEFDIDVFELRPGVIATDMTAGVKEKYDRLFAEGLTLNKRWGRPEDVAKAAAMLARGDLCYATGAVIHIDGGLTSLRL